MPWKDSNPHRRNQNPTCYHYTTRQGGCHFVLTSAKLSTFFNSAKLSRNFLRFFFATNFVTIFMEGFTQYHNVLHLSANGGRCWRQKKAVSFASADGLGFYLSEFSGYIIRRRSRHLRGWPEAWAHRRRGIAARDIFRGIAQGVPRSWGQTVCRRWR